MAHGFWRCGPHKKDAKDRVTLKRKEDVMVKLGTKYKDSISGFSGIATARTTYMYGCVRVCLSPTKTDKEGHLLEDFWLDEPQLKDMRGRKVQSELDPPAGPRGDAVRALDPKR